MNPTQRLLTDTITRAAWTRADSTVVDTETWFQVRTPSSKTSALNSIRRAVLLPQEVEPRIAKVLEDHSRRQAELDWTLTPVCRPEALLPTLMKLGFSHIGRSNGMARRVERVAMPTGVQVRRIDVREAGLYAQLAVLGWGMPPDTTGELEKDVRSCLTSPEMKYYVAFVGLQPVGTAAIRLMPDRGYLLGASVIPEFRRRNVYRALLSARLGDLAAWKLQLAVTLALQETSAPVCDSFGFRTICNFEHMLWSPKIST